MSTTYTPTQYRANDPYQQRILQFDSQDSKVYLSRTSNQLLKAFGNDVVIKGFDILSQSFDSDIFEVVLDSGTLIQDTTLINVTEPSTLSIDVSGLDDCNGYLIIYTDYQYIESIGLNRFSLKIAHTNDTGLVFVTDTASVSWVPARNRIYLNVFRFTKGSPNTVQEKTYPKFLNLGGYRYEQRGGASNFLKSSETYPPPTTFYHQLANRYDAEDSLKLVTQLRSPDDDVSPIENLQLLTSVLSVNIDEYKPFDDAYRLIVSNPNDASVFTVDSLTIPTSGASTGLYVLEHNLGQQYFIVDVYDDEGNLFRPSYINFTDANNLTISFANIISDLAASYTIVLVKDNLTIVELELDELTTELVDIEHDLNKYHLIVQLIDPTDNLYINNNNSIFNVQDSNTIVMDTTICNLVEGTYNIVIYDNPEYIYNLYSSDYYSIYHNIFVEKIYESNLESGILHVEHNLNDTFPATGMMYSDLSISYPEEIEIVDEDQVYLSISSTTSGSSGTPSGSSGLDIDDSFVYVYSYGGNSVHSLTSLTSGTSGTGSNYTYTLDLSAENHENVVFQVYDSDNKLIIPSQIIEVIADQEYIFEFPIDFDPTGVRILVIQGYYSYSESFMTPPDLAPVLVTHNLSSLYLFITIFDIYSQVIYPAGITIVDENTISIDTTNLISSSNYKINIATGMTRQNISFTLNNSYYQEFSSIDLVDDSITIDHNLNFVCPVIQVYDDENNLVSDINIQIIDNNSVYLTFPESVELLLYYKVIIMKPSL